MDKEIRKLIGFIQELGTVRAGEALPEVTFGELFTATENAMEAVAGTLKTAKKFKVVSFDSEVLFQGTHDHVVIRLLKTEIPDSTADTYTYRQIRAVSVRRQKGKAFGSGTQVNQKCQK